MKLNFKFPMMLFLNLLGVTSNVNWSISLLKIKVITIILNCNSIIGGRAGLNNGHFLKKNTRNC